MTSPLFSSATQQFQGFMPVSFSRGKSGMYIFSSPFLERWIDRRTLSANLSRSRFSYAWESPKQAHRPVSLLFVSLWWGLIGIYHEAPYHCSCNLLDRLIMFVSVVQKRMVEMSAPAHILGHQLGEPGICELRVRVHLELALHIERTIQEQSLQVRSQDKDGAQVCVG